MKAWPRTLFQRNMLLIAVLIVVAQLSSAVLFRELVMKPRVRQSAQSAAQHIEALRAGLAALPHEQRQAFLDRMNARAQAPAASGADAVQVLQDGGVQRLAPLERAYIEQITQSISKDGAQVQWRREPGHPLAVQITLDGDHYWMTLPGLVSSQGVPRTWVIGSVITALLAIWGAWLIQRRLNRPLARVIEAAQALGRGERAPALPEDGPSEIATVARGFNEMSANLAGHERERALMLAGLSHDLRTPLTKIRLATEMLQGQGDAALLASVDRSIDSMEHLLQQFMDFTRASHGAGAAQEPLLQVDVNDLVRETVAMCVLDEAGGDDVRLNLGEVPQLKLPVHAMRRVLLNLLVNAQRHGRPPIDVVTRVVQQRLFIEVMDRGPGIAASDIDQVKRPFAQGNEARSHLQSGAGLGLAIVERIAQAHQARLGLLPREGGGLMARLDWPLHEARPTLGQGLDQ
jgi:two-component system, OmpR family, osmolarity sensor histidine kinase EnvZ